MARLSGCICVLLTMTCCGWGTTSEKAFKSSYATDSIVIFLTGNALGELKPCGCSGGELGGLERRAAVFKAVEPSRRLIIDTGNLLQDQQEQSLIKYHTMIQAFNLLNYDLINLTASDIEAGKSTGLLGNIGTFVNAISTVKSSDANIPRVFSKKFSLKNEAITINVASYNPENQPIEVISSMFPPGKCEETVNILIVEQNKSNLSASISKLGIVDCVIYPPADDKPAIVCDVNAHPLNFSVGRQGKYITSLEVVPIKGAKKPKLVFSAIAVTGDLPDDKALADLYKAYQNMVHEAGLLENHPRKPLLSGLKYEGSLSCKPCHAYEYEKWSDKPHAIAFATLEKVGSDYDPECVICHVVGMDYESGFETPEKSQEDLRNVGCENCHGPGSEHNKSEGRIETVEPKSKCLDCHTPEHSANYLGNEDEYFKKIVHWRELKTKKNVDNKGSTKEK